MHPSPALLRLCRLLPLLLLCLPALLQAAVTPVSLQLSGLHQYAFAGYYAALHKGFYEEASLQVRLQEGSSRISPASAVAEGKSDFGIAGPELVLDYLKGKPVVLLAPILQHSPNILLALRADARLSDLINAGPVALHDGAQDTELRAMFLNEGISAGNVHFTANDRPLEQMLKLRYAAVSGSLISDPFLLRQQGIDFSILHPQSHGLDFYGDLLFTRHNLLNKSPDVVAAFRRASLRGWEYALSHPEEMVNLIHRQYNSQRRTLEQLRNEAQALQGLIDPQGISLGHNNPGRWQHMVQTYARFGILDPRLASNLPADLLDDFFYDHDPKPLPAWLLPVSLGSLLGLLLLGALVMNLLRLRRRLKRSQSELQSNRLLLAEAQRIAHLGCWEYDSTRNSLTLNEEAREIYAPDHRGMPVTFTDLQSCIVTEDRARVMQAMETALAQGSDYDIEYRVQSRRHGLRFLQVRGHVLSAEGSKGTRLIGSVLDITAQKQHEQRLQQSAQTDYLTGICNRRHFVDEGTRDVRRAIRQEAAMTLVILDIDNFKRVNDRYGHPTGDQVLVTLTRIMQEALRGADRLGRLGGEEFAILLPDTDEARARLVAERIRAAVAATNITVTEGHSLHVTLSIGLASWQSPRDSFDLMLNRADQALGQAKERGRNCICIAGQESEQA